jgi:hypothetical protein
MQPTAATRRLREILGAAALLVVGCDGIATVEVQRSSMAVFWEDVDPGEIDFGEFDNEEDVTSDDIAGAHVTSVVLEVVDPEDGDLQFADNVEIYIDAPGLERQLVAFGDDFPAGESRLVLEVAHVDLEPYVLADSIGFTAEVDGEAPDDDVIIEATATIDVGITAEGACNYVGR